MTCNQNIILSFKSIITIILRRKAILGWFESLKAHMTNLTPCIDIQMTTSYVLSGHLDLHCTRVETKITLNVNFSGSIQCSVCKYISYTLKYTVFNATLCFYFLFSLRHVSAALVHHQVFCCQSCLTVIYI
jgi:hypothetical protein